MSDLRKVVKYSMMLDSGRAVVRHTHVLHLLEDVDFPEDQIVGMYATALVCYNASTPATRLDVNNKDHHVDEVEICDSCFQTLLDARGPVYV